MRAFLRVSALLVFMGALLVAVVILYARHAHGFSARAEPTRMEALLAHEALRFAMPTAAKNMANPVPGTPQVLQEGMAHFADHCAVCHGNNGDGQTMLGSGMYPKPPDLRAAATQGKTDGELFYVIENGVRMSGMPAFSSPGTADDSWKLVDFIRHLPTLSEQEQATMEHLNPKGPDERREEEEENNFLRGTGISAASGHAAMKGTP